MVPDPIPSTRSRPVIIRPHDPRWHAEYVGIAAAMRIAIGDHATRIDHIGSTSVAGLCAKDVIDIQVTVADLHECTPLVGALRGIGYRRGATIEFDATATRPVGDSSVAKRYMREPEGERRTHVHIRADGSHAQRMALLFRDYLRATPTVREQYDTVKRRAAQLFPESIDGYMWLKDAPRVRPCTIWGSPCRSASLR